MQGIKISVQFLRKRNAHQRISYIYDKLGKGHFYKAATGGDYANTCGLPGGGKVGKRNSHCGKNRKSKPRGKNSETEGNRKIAKADGESVADSFNKIFFHFSASCFKI